MVKRTVLLLIALVLCLGFSDSLLAQRKKQPIKKSTAIKSSIPLSKIYQDIVGKSLDIFWIDGGYQTKWTFAANETREIEIVKSEIGKENASVTIRMLTQDAAPNENGLWSSLKGNLRLQYERIAGGWLLTKVENIDFKYTVRNNNGESVNPELLFAQNKRTTTVENSQTVQETFVVPQTQVSSSVFLVNNVFTVAPGKLQYFQFNVNGKATVVGKFRAQGGSRNDIKVYILNQDGFENYRNGNNTPTFYNSGQVTVGTVYSVLLTGSYYLVFDNSFSLLSNKAVTATVELKY